MAANDAGEGGPIPTIFVGLAVLVVVAWFAMLVGAGLLAVWVGWQFITRRRWRDRLSLDLGAATVGALAGAGVALRYTGWYLVVAGVAAVLAALVLMAREREPSHLWLPAMITTCAVGVASAFFGTVSTMNADPRTVLVEVDYEGGTTATLEGGFASAECLAGTMQADVSPDPTLSFDGREILRVGRCVVSTDTSAQPVHLFLASSAGHLNEWLSRGGLRGTAGNLDDIEVFRDGSVAVVSTDYLSAHMLRDAGLHSLEVVS